MFSLSVVTIKYSLLKVNNPETSFPIRLWNIADKINPVTKYSVTKTTETINIFLAILPNAQSSLFVFDQDGNNGSYKN